MVNDRGLTGFDGDGRQAEASKLLRFLPSIYEQDPFIGRFLRIFEDIHDPLQAIASTLPQYFDPAIAPRELGAFIGSWVGSEREGDTARLSDSRWGRLARESVWLHRWRGTKRGLRRALEIATGFTPMITDFADGLVLSGDASLGVNTSLGSGAPRRVVVTFDCEPDLVDSGVVDAIIRRHKPAHVTHEVTFNASRSN